MPEISIPASTNRPRDGCRLIRHTFTFGEKKVKEEVNAILSDPVQLHASYMGETHQEPRGPRVAAKQYIEGVGGKLHGFWYALGDHDGYNLWEAPDNVSMAATVIAMASAER